MIDKERPGGWCYIFTPRDEELDGGDAYFLGTLE